MDISCVVQSEDFVEAPYDFFGNSNFRILESHIRLSRGDTPIQVVDPRFETPYTTWKQLQACANLRLTLWCLKPSDSSLNKMLQYGIYVIGKPVACVLDLGVDSLLCIARTIVISEYVYFIKGWRRGLESFVKVFSQLLDTVCLVHFLGPRGSRMWSYYVKNRTTNQNEFILDAGKVRFLREKCGWEHVTDEKFKELGNVMYLSTMRFLQDRPEYSYEKLKTCYHLNANLSTENARYWSSNKPVYGFPMSEYEDDSALLDSLKAKVKKG